MVEYVTSELYRLLVAQGLANGTAGTEPGAGMKKAGRSQIGATPQVMAGAEGGGGPHRPVGESVNTHEPSPSPEEARPVLMLVSSRQNLAQRKTKRAKSCLVLVSSR